MLAHLKNFKVTHLSTLRRIRRKKEALNGLNVGKTKKNKKLNNPNIYSTKK
ncbi:hypothetical protein EXN66_Car006362 [Channa argus]|uniref:Uncharacterized protein n=1 Tax=Channa argus TaxID=215402 RepID=A0A6G1PKE3_CHAAH|nr:hypothetical protein EXN66_Car006362 [Channa argus]